MAAAPPSQGWFYFLTADPQLIGTVSWLGLVITTAGFWIAIAQIRKVRKAAQAANAAVTQLVKVVRSQEQAAKINSAVGHLASAQSMLKQQNFDAAAAHLSVGWNDLISARELTDDGEDRDRIEAFVISTRRLLDDISAPSASKSTTAKTAGNRHAELSKSLSGLGRISARLSALLSGLGSS